MNKQWMALLLSTGIAVTACPVPAAQMPPEMEFTTVILRPILMQ